MIGLILANVWRRRARTLLTATGIAVGVATIVALLSLTSGLERRAGELVHLGAADLGLFQRDAADPTTSVLPLGLIESLEARDDIAQATPLQLLVEAVPADPAAVVFGAEPGGFFTNRLVMREGRAAGGPGEIAIGDRLAEQLGLGVGDRLRVKQRRLRITGVYHAGIFFEDSGGVIPLRAAQRLAGRRADEATTIAVTLEPNARLQDVEAALNRDYPSVLTISEPEEAARIGANSVLISNAVPILVILALVVGGLGVANTMVMAVLERQRETALLATVGWSPRQLAMLVMGEAVAVSVLGCAIGLALGVAAAELLVRALDLLDVIAPHITAWTLLRGVLVGIAIGVLGGLYPTWRVTRQRPGALLAQG